MKLVWADAAWADYLYWLETDRKIIKRINKIIEDIKQNPFQGIGNPEPLRYNWQGYWSRRITREHRLVYKPEGVESCKLQVSSCKEKQKGCHFEPRHTRGEKSGLSPLSFRP